MLNYFSSSTVFGVIRLSYSECNHNVTEIARFSKGDFGNVHCNTESVNSNTDWTQVCDLLYICRFDIITSLKNFKQEPNKKRKYKICMFSWRKMTTIFMKK